VDRKRAWRDNVFVEWLRGSIRYEEVYLEAYYDTVTEARVSTGRCIRFCNSRRPHSSLDQRTRDLAYFNSLPQIAVA
jgi:putative transposase